MKSIDPIAILRERCSKASQYQVAKELGVSQGYLNQVLNGNFAPGKSILKPLGLARVISYRRIRPSGGLECEAGQ